MEMPIFDVSTECPSCHHEHDRFHLNSMKMEIDNDVVVSAGQREGYRVTRRKKGEKA